MSGCCDNDSNNIPGPVGPQGPAGNDGVDGLPGPNGATGPAGVDGPQGIQGIDGPAGVAGDDGASYLTGTGNPIASLGEDGDTYSNNSNGEIFTKNSGVWTFTGFDLQGPQGPQGSIGLTGATGASGTNGTNGIDGNDGLGYDNTTSSTSTDILDTADTSVNMTWDPLKAFISGSRVRIADSSNPSVNYFEGIVNLYDQITGNAIVDTVVVKNGTGTLTAWNVSITGEQGGSSGGETLAQTLILGNLSGSNDIDINAGQNTRHESPAVADANIVGAEFYTNTFASKVGHVGYRSDNDEVELDGNTKDVRITGQNTIIECPTTKALVLPSSNNPTVDVTVPIEGMVKYQAQGGSEDIEGYVNGAWVSLTSSGSGDSIMDSNHTQTAFRIQDFNGFTQVFSGGILALQNTALHQTMNNIGNVTLSVLVNLDVSNMFKFVVGSNFTLNFNPILPPCFFSIKITQDATGSRLVTLGANIVTEGGAGITLSTGANEVDWLDGISDGGKVYLSIRKNWS